MELKAAIHILLARLSYVSLPGLGSFVKCYVPAKLSTDGKSIVAPLEYFVFDTARNFNDEALENHLVHTLGVSTNEANEMVKDFINEITIDLTSGRAIYFPCIGTLNAKPSGGIELTCDTNCTATQTYGLPDIEVSPKTPVEAKPSSKPKLNKKTDHTPDQAKTGLSLSSKLVAIIVAAVVLTGVAALLIWKFDVVPHIKSRVQIAQVAPNASPSAPATPMIADSIEHEQQPDPTLVKSQRGVEISADKKSALLYLERTPDNLTHYVIVGSFAQINNATKLINELTAKGYKPQLLEDNGIFRVAIYKFTTRDRALRELERLKTQNIAKTVWLYSK